MNYGMYLSAAGALTSMHRQNVHTNNLANMTTVGFKPDAVYTRQRDPERVESPQVFSEPNWLLEKLGGGLSVQPSRATFPQGTLTPSSNDLDLAIDGDGLFVVREGSQQGEKSLRFTRDGQLTLNRDGQLVTVTGGLRVMDTSNRPIRLDRTAPVLIDEDGTIHQRDARVAQIQIIAAPASDTLRRTGQNLMRLEEGAVLTRLPAGGRVMQRHTEASAVDPIKTMNDIIGAAKTAQANMKLMQYHDNMLGQTFNTFGRVS